MLTFASLREMETRNCLYYFCNFMSEIQNLKIFLRHISDQVGWENITYITGPCKHIVNYLFLYILKKFYWNLFNSHDRHFEK